MPNPQNIIKHQMKKGETLNPNGRPKKLVSGLISELKAKGYENVKASQVTDVIELMIGLDREEIIRLGSDNDQPMYVRIVARKLASTNDKDLFETIEKLLDRGHGKAMIKQDITSKGNHITGINISVIDSGNKNE